MFGIYRYILVTSYLIISCVCFDKIALNNAADFLIQTSRAMSKPYMWTRVQMARLYSPFTPGEFGQYDTLMGEVLYRNILAESLWHMFPQAFIVGELAVGPRFLSYALRGDSYHYLKGNREPITHSDRTFTLMNMNICFLPAELPLLFGGVASSAERVDKVASLVKEHEPDVLCLYEAHEVDSTYALYEALKDDYAYFYVDIGPDLMEFNSGLFVASKFAVKDVNFKPFQYLRMQSQINKGYFEFTILDDDKPLAKIYTTHLQPFREKSDVNIRIQELHELVKDIHTEHSEVPYYPIILCGDFNIPWGTKEYVRSEIEETFYNDFGSKIDQINEDTRTYSALLGDQRWKTVDKTLLKEGSSNDYFEIVDYMLVFNKTDKMLIDTERIETFNTHFPGHAISDHHALMTTIYIGD
jgi:endonuclease/exonuclease/phosphatase family metal-dependent hydrolase